MTDDAPRPGGPRYCLRCRTRLPHRHPLDDGPEAPGKCPRCGLPFDPTRPETTWDRPMPFRWRFWLPAFLVIVVAGVGAYAALLGTDRAGYALFFGVPFAVGMAIGFEANVAFWIKLMLSLTAISCVAFVLVFMNLSGIFCGLTLSLVFFGPALAGCVVGWVLRVLIRDAAWDKRRYAIAPVFLLTPMAVDLAESCFPAPREVAEVSTSVTFDAPERPTWDAIVFYEQVEHAPPFLLTMALPRPARTEGRKEKVGDVQRCIYQHGYLVKTISRLDPPRFLAFDVTEQHLDFEQDVELLDGSFIVQPVDDARTRVVLTTRYRRLLRPAWVWRPIEEAVIHALHDHVLEGMRRKAVGEG